MNFKKLLYTASLALLLGATSCTDDFEEINTDPNKLYSVDISYIFPGTVYRTMNALGELNYNYLFTYSRYAPMIPFCTPRQEEGDGFYGRFYVEILRDLEEADVEYKDKEGYENRRAIVKTWKAYTYYILASMYGGIPMSDAMLTEEAKTEYKYDTELQVYTQILELLKEAVELYNPETTYTTDILSPDPVFSTDNTNTLWRKFANTLRLNIGLHIQNLSPGLSKEHVTEAMKQEDWIISQNSENVIPKWGTNTSYDVSYYYNRVWKDLDVPGSNFEADLYPTMGEYFSLYLFTFKDPRMAEYFDESNSSVYGAGPAERPYLYADTISRPHICERSGRNRCENYTSHQNDGLNNVRRDSLIVRYSIPFVPGTEYPYMASGWEAALIDANSGSDARYTDPLISTNSKYNRSFVKRKYLDKDADMIILTYADACFLKAEANILYGVGQKSAEQYYNEGIQASFSQYGISGEVSDYMNQDGVKWNTTRYGFKDRRLLYQAKVEGRGGDENHLEQIYKQRYIAGYLNCLEAWNMERRTRALGFPPQFSQGLAGSSIEGLHSVYNYGMERFIYPRTEISQNKDQYYLAIENLRQTSPFFREDRWGDNIFTSLGIAMKNPEMEIADSRYRNLKIAFYAGYFSHYYGDTYEKMLKEAFEMTGETNEEKAMVKAFNYEVSTVLTTYLPEGGGIDF